MTNIFDFRTGHPVMEAPPPVIALDPMPAWITTDPALNAAVTRLQRHGWTIRAMPDHTLFCWHPRVLTRNNNPVDFTRAVEIQVGFEVIEGQIGRVGR